MNNTALEAATQIVLDAIFLAASKTATSVVREEFIADRVSALSTQTESLRLSAINLQIALARMKAANERLAERLREHKAFVDKHRPT